MVESELTGAQITKQRVELWKPYHLVDFHLTSIEHTLCRKWLWNHYSTYLKKKLIDSVNFQVFIPELASDKANWADILLIEYTLTCNMFWFCRVRQKISGWNFVNTSLDSSEKRVRDWTSLEFHHFRYKLRSVVRSMTKSTFHCSITNKMDAVYLSKLFYNPRRLAV